MRIGLVSYEYPPQKGLGGVGTYIVRLAGALGRAGHQVIVLAGPSHGEEAAQPNVQVVRLAARYDPPLPMRALRWLYWRGAATLLDRMNPLVWHWLRWDLATKAALREIDREWPLDVIEAPEHAANGLIAAYEGKWPLVVRTHGPWDLFFGINRTAGMAMNHLLAELERRSAELADVRTAPSRTMSRFIARRWNLTEPPMPVPNFMDVPEVPPPLPRHDEPPRIVCAGRIERFKGQDVLVEAFVRVAGRHPAARLILIGPDQWSRKQTFASVVDGLCPDPSIRLRIELTGAQPLDVTQAELRRAAVAVVPSSGFESFSFSTLEAMAAGRPTIVCRSGAMPELLDYGRCGRVVPPGDSLRLGEALDELLSDRRMCEHLSQCAHERARTVYDTHAVLPLFMEAFERARDEHRARRRTQLKRRSAPRPEPLMDSGLTLSPVH